MWISLLIVAFLWSLSLQFRDTEANEKVCVLNLWYFLFFSLKNRKFRRGKPPYFAVDVKFALFEKMFPKWDVSVYSVAVYCNSAPVTCYANFSQAIKNEWFALRPIASRRRRFFDFGMNQKCDAKTFDKVREFSHYWSECRCVLKHLWERFTLLR